MFTTVFVRLWFTLSVGVKSFNECDQQRFGNGLEVAAAVRSLLMGSPGLEFLGGGAAMVESPTWTSGPRALSITIC